MKRIVTTHVAVTVGLTIIAAFMAAYFVWGSEPPKQLANILLLGTATTISVGWAPAFWKSIKRGLKTGTARLIATVWLSWTALLIHRIYIIINDSLRSPEWLTTGPWSILIVALITASGWYAVIAPITDPDILASEKRWDRVAIALGTIVIAAALFVYLSSRI